MSENTMLKRLPTPWEKVTVCFTAYFILAPSTAGLEHRYEQRNVHRKGCLSLIQSDRFRYSF
jgi:hypothetical protein